MKNIIGSHKTCVFKDNDILKIVYHSTVVVAETPTEIILNTGGFQSLTTKRRMNQASKEFNLNYRVFQKNFNWYAEYKGNIIPFEGDKLTLAK